MMTCLLVKYLRPNATIVLILPLVFWRFEVVFGKLSPTARWQRSCFVVWRRVEYRWVVVVLVSETVIPRIDFCAADIAFFLQRSLVHGTQAIRFDDCCGLYIDTVCGTHIDSICEIYIDSMCGIYIDSLVAYHHVKYTSILIMEHTSILIMEHTSILWPWNIH